MNELNRNACNMTVASSRYLSEENKFESIQGAEGGRDTKKNI